MEILEQPKGSFLFTWKAAKWDYEKLKALVEKFDRGETVIESWRCQAHRQVYSGARGYLYKQGPAPNGVFGVATVIGPAIKRAEVQDGEGEYEVPLRFDLLLDPEKQAFLLTKDQMLAFPDQPNLNTQASGIRIPQTVALALDAAAQQVRPRTPISVTGAIETSSPVLSAKNERMIEVYGRNQEIITDLKRLYNGRCQICDSQPFNGQFGSIVEGHHIMWLSRNGLDARENIVLLCPNHHAAIHAADPTFDWDKLQFHFGLKALPIRVDLHLRHQAK